MSRPFEDFFEVPDHGKVGYTLSKRGSFYMVRFIDRKNRYVRKTTGMTERNEARIEAGRLILRAYRPEQFEKLAPLTWDELLQKLETAMTVNGNRPRSYDAYACALHAIRDALPETTGPHDIGPDEAQRFKEQFLSTGFKKSKAKDAVIHERSKVSFNCYLRHARSIWSKWFKELKMAGPNPWKSVAFAKVDKKTPEAPDEDVLVEFFQFVRNRYPGWDMPILFLQTKCLVGCRLMDLCSLRSDQLRHGALIFGSENLKTRDFRRVPLPPNLYRALDDLKGETFLWERYPEQCYACLTAQGKHRAAVRLHMQFTPKNFSEFIVKLFRWFQKATGKRLRSHMLRKRAITLLFAEGVPAQVAAKMLGMDVQTAQKYYLDMDKIDTSKKFSEFADKLIPPG